MQASEEDDAALSDLNRTATYRFSQLGLGRPTDLGWPGSDPPPRPVTFFLAYPVYSFCKSLIDSKIRRNKFVSPNLVFQISL
jgi:hypothetical protein